MSDHRRQIEELQQQARALGNGRSKIALLEEAVRIADTHQDLDAGFDTRHALLHAATFSARPDLLLASFAWCLAQCDRHPERFDITRLLWEYKWIVTAAPRFLGLGRAQLDGLLADMGRRFDQAGVGQHPVHHKRREVAVMLGDRAAALAAHRAMLKTPRGWISDCPACIADEAVGFLLFLGLDERAVAVAAPILAGRCRCAEVPHRTYARLLLPLLRLGRVAEALDLHRKGYRLVAHNEELLACAASHLMFLALIGDWTAAIRGFERQVPLGLAAVSVLDRFAVLLAGVLFLRLVKRQGPTIQLRLPADVPPHRADGTYAVADLRRWLGKELRQLAEALDARNGNDHYSRRRRGLKRLEALASSLPASEGDGVE